MTDLTTEQARRMEALNNAAALLVDRSVSPANFLSKGTESLKADGLIGSVLETRDMHLASAVIAATDLAEYIINGPEREQPHIVIDEDGTRIEDGR